MKKNKFKKHEQKWARMALVWEEFAKPGRPSKDDIKNYELLLNIAVKNTDSPRVIILGATPELRNMLHGLSRNINAEIICVDMI
ncbi:hypothetical protein AUJ27_02780 [Candidatus Falkowbacteria bacterium CG1_02_37_44]|uniref:Uncharacterized protein n=2 Tax=Candidatus Falkowiibacteriota TaxID=1752728 RepID=A0A1J4T5D1_9BACT|nr:MAG: hypothetical protein AUJ27_02780 [Candidatus Falkowbacteria bacterium CG1_02_37_44]PIV51786.1 MAG: hypothetical protein COS18_01935 [Candidatus Falkowbacteria bacterium CG02_land_8_20_14_3_00_36_14]